MRYLLQISLLFAAVVLAAPFAEAQVCEGDITLKTQAEVDAFACPEVSGALYIGDPVEGPSYDIVNLDGLSGLASVGSDVTIKLVLTLADIGGLSSLTSIGGRLRIRDNPVLTSLDGLAGLTSVGGRVEISSLAALTSLDGLAGLTSVGGGLEIFNNGALTDLSGLGGLSGVGGELRIIENSALMSLAGLNALTSVGRIWIYNNSALTSLEGLDNITSLGGFLRIEDNDALTSLTSLSGLTYVAGLLFVYDNDELTSLDGLGGLTSVGGSLWISGNDALENVDSLSNIGSVGNDLYITANRELAACTVGLGELLMAEEENTETIGGIVDIRHNAPGCNSYWEVINGTVDAEDEATPFVTGLAAPYPNPTVGAATLTYSLAEPAEVTLTLYDSLGRRVRTLAEGPQSTGAQEVTLDAELPAGTYVVRFETDGQSWTKRVTVVR